MHVEFESGPPPCRLSMAVLVYENYRDELVLTRHDVSNGTIQPGEPLDTGAFLKLFKQEEGKASTNGITYSFPRVLAEHAKFVAWWSAPGYRTILIQDGSKVKGWFPGMVWVGRRNRCRLHLMAYAGDGEPTKDTDVYQPVFSDQHNHIHADLGVCLGVSSKSTTPEAYESAFWNTKFHSFNPKLTKPYGQKKTNHKGTVASVLTRLASAH